MYFFWRIEWERDFATKLQQKLSEHREGKAEEQEVEEA